MSRAVTHPRITLAHTFINVVRIIPYFKRNFSGIQYKANRFTISQFQISLRIFKILILILKSICAL